MAHELQFGSSKMLLHVLVPSLLLISLQIIEPQFVWKTYTKKNNRTIEFPSEYLKMGEDTPSFRSKRSNLSHSLDEKCERGLGLGVGFQVYTPYVDLGFNTNSKGIVLSGIFPNVVVEMLRYCCPKSEVEYASYITSISDLESQFRDKQHSEMDITFPAYGLQGKYTTRFMDFPFLPIVEASKISVLVHGHKEKQVTKRACALISTIANSWPMVVFIFISAGIAGIALWLLDRNTDQFPPRFLRGTWEGFWCAFVTMTTVGYGDFAPKSLVGRTFCMIWILLGIIVISTFTGLIASALLTSGGERFTMRGSVIGAIHGSEEFKIGVGLNAEMRAYDDIYSMIEDLKDDLDGAMVDNFILSASMDILQGKNIHVELELHYPVTYGIVLSENSSAIEKCGRHYLDHYSSSVFTIIANKTVPFKEPKKSFQRMVETSVVQKLFYEEKSFRYLLYTEAGLLLLAVVTGILLEYWGWRTKLLPCIMSKSQRNHSTNKNQVLIKCLGTGRSESANDVAVEDTLISAHEIQGLLVEYNDFHAAWVKKVKSCYNIE